MSRLPVLALLALAVPAAAAAEEPKPGPSALIRTWLYRPLVPLDLKSYAGKPVVLVLDPGERVLHFTALRVRPTPELARRAGGWVMPANVFQPARGQAQRPAAPAKVEDADGDGEETQAAQTAPPAPNGEIHDQITLQPMKAPQEPQVLQLMTEAADGTKRPWLIVLHAEEKDDPAKSYAQVIVNYTRPPDPAAVAAAQAARQQAMMAAQQQRVLTRLQQAEAQSALQGQDAYDAAPGARSPQGCAFLKPVLTQDDGAWTTLTFGPHQPRPQVYSFTRDGAEPTHLQPITVTRADGGVDYRLPGVHAQLRLASDSQVCGLRNRRLGQMPVGPATGTISADVALVPRRQGARP